MIDNSMFSFNEYLIFVIAYLIGSIPFGVLVAKAYGCSNLTSQGSGNIGATNVVRVCGKRAGVTAFILDFLKSAIPTTIYIYQFGMGEGALTCGLLAVFGHILPVFNRFRGGKGVATSFGALAAINPAIAIITTLIWVACYKITKISSASALLSFALMPFAFLFYNPDMNTMVFAITISLVIYIRHIENIKRLLNGQENGFK